MSFDLLLLGGGETPAVGDDEPETLAAGRSDDHVTRAQSKLIPWFQKPRMLAMLAAYVRPLQQAEDLLWTVVDGMMLDNAIGAQLDILGRVVGQPRQGVETDDQYRAIIRGRIRINRSYGRAEDIIDAIRIMLGGDATGLYYADVQPATIYVAFSELTDLPIETIMRLASRAKIGGVRWVSSFLPSGAEEAFFYWGDVGDPDSSAGAGDSTNEATGGALADTWTT